MFNGWYDPDGVEQYTDTTLYTNTFSTAAKAVWTPVQSSVVIQYNSGIRIINYRSTLILHAKAENLPFHSEIAWFVDGVQTGLGDTFTLTEIKDDFTVTARLIDRAGHVLTNADGSALYDQQIVHVNGGFFRVLLAFFQWLFHALPVVENQ